MKTRIVVMSLIFVVAPIIAGCGGSSETENRAAPENRAASETDKKQGNAELTDRLRQASELLEKAQSELDQSTTESELRALRTLGYPAFVVDDFGNARPFIAKLKSNPRKKLSDYLFKHFGTTTIELLEGSEEPPSEALLGALAVELNSQLRNPNLYNVERFPATNVSPLTKAEIERNGGIFNRFSPETLALVNRLLLRDSYPTTFGPPPTENVLQHLGAAATLVKNSSDLQIKFGPGVNKLLEDTKQLFRKSSEADQEISLSSSAVRQLNSAVAIVLKDLDPSHPQPPPSSDGIDWAWWEQVAKQVLKYVLVFCGAAVLVGAIFYGVKRLRHRSAVREQKITQAFDDFAARHDKLLQDFTSFKNQQANEIDQLKQQISRVENEQRNPPKQPVRSNNDPNQTFPVNRYYEPPLPPPVKEEPEFPIAAETYLRRLNGLNRQSTIIRPDFQNGILVKDADGRGELLLIEDPHRPVDFQRLLVVPSVSEFQMRQDFYNYYDNYYECDQPTAGAIWILNPAIVEKVSGGWRLTEKGRLEVR